MSSRRPALVLRVPSRTEFLAAIRDVTRRMAEAAGFDGAQADQLALAVDEASTNVIEHAYRGAPGRTIELRFRDDGRRPARGGRGRRRARWTRATCRRWTSQRYASERRTGGLGMHLMGRIMDSRDVPPRGPPQRLLHGQAQAGRREPRPLP